MTDMDSALLGRGVIATGRGLSLIGEAALDSVSRDVLAVLDIHKIDASTSAPYWICAPFQSRGRAISIIGRLAGARDQGGRAGFWGVVAAIDRKSAYRLGYGVLVAQVEALFHQIRAEHFDPDNRTLAVESAGRLFARHDQGFPDFDLVPSASPELLGISLDPDWTAYASVQDLLMILDRDERFDGAMSSGFLMSAGPLERTDGSIGPDLLQSWLPALFGSMEGKLERLQAEHTELQAREAHAQKENVALKQDLAELTPQLERLRHAHDTAQTKLSQAQGTIKGLQREAQRAIQDAQTAVQERNRIKADRISIEVDLNDRKREIDELKQKVKRLQNLASRRPPAGPDWPAPDQWPDPRDGKPSHPPSTASHPMLNRGVGWGRLTAALAFVAIIIAGASILVSRAPEFDLGSISLASFWSTKPLNATDCPKEIFEGFNQEENSYRQCDSQAICRAHLNNMQHLLGDLMRCDATQPPQRQLFHSSIRKQIAGIYRRGNDAAIEDLDRRLEHFARRATILRTRVNNAHKREGRPRTFYDGFEGSNQ